MPDTLLAIEHLRAVFDTAAGPAVAVDDMESGKSFKVLTRKHLAKYGLTPEEYREKWGYPKGMPLVCKALQRERRKKMREMRLWERRGKAKAE